MMIVAMLVLAAISFNTGIPGQELLQTMRFHIAALLVALPIALVVLGAPRRAMLLLAVIVLSVGQGGWVVFDQLARRASLEAAPQAGSFSLLSFNVMATNPEGGRIAAHLEETLPDVAILLEASAAAAEMPRLDAAYPHRIGCAAPDNCDTVLLSRLPVEASQIYRIGPFKRERLIVARIAVAGRSVTVMALHLSKPYFDDFAWIELSEVRALLRKVEGPLVLAGDFNAAPWAYWEARIASQMQLVPAPTFPATWPVALGDFGVPIDNVFTREALVTRISALADPMGSNHRGLVATIAIPAGP